MDHQPANQGKQPAGTHPTLNWKTTDPDDVKSLPPINWNALQEYAVDLMRLRLQEQPEQQSIITCRMATEYNIGGLHLVRLLHFNNGARWVARIQLHECTINSTKRLLHEVYTISLIRERTKIPVPEVFGYEPDSSNTIGAAFMIMEFIPGDTAMDAFGGWDSHRGKIPPKYKPEFCRVIAQYQAELASLRFPKIGSIIKREDGAYDVGPIPGLGGPFETASKYLEAWANHAKFPTSKDRIRKQLPPKLADEMILSIQDFPTQLRTLAKQEKFIEEGPFPLYHTDLLHSNIIINKDYNVLAIIDWENACTVPWEVVELPLFLSTVPLPMDAPWNYDKNGEPKDEYTRQMRLERQKYIDSVKEAEEDRSFDNRLSGTLADRHIQNFAAAIKLYLEPGKIGFYHKVLEPFCSIGEPQSSPLPLSPSPPPLPPLKSAPVISSSRLPSPVLGLDRRC